MTYGPAWLNEPPKGLILQNDGLTWLGTFGVLVRALADDLLPEGPVNAHVVTHESQTHTGRLERIFGSRLGFEDGTEIEIEHIARIHVA